MAYQATKTYPIEVISLTLPIFEPAGFCPFCQIELERERYLDQSVIFCTSCDFSQPEYGG